MDKIIVIVITIICFIAIIVIVKKLLKNDNISGGVIISDGRNNAYEIPVEGVEDTLQYFLSSNTIFAMLQNVMGKYQNDSIIFDANVHRSLQTFINQQGCDLFMNPSDMTDNVKSLMINLKNDINRTKNIIEDYGVGEDGSDQILTINDDVTILGIYPITNTVLNKSIKIATRSAAAAAAAVTVTDENVDADAAANMTAYENLQYKSITGFHEVHPCNALSIMLNGFDPNKCGSTDGGFFGIGYYFEPSFTMGYCRAMSADLYRIPGLSEFVGGRKIGFKLVCNVYYKTYAYPCVIHTEINDILRSNLFTLPPMLDRNYETVVNEMNMTALAEPLLEKINYSCISRTEKKEETFENDRKLYGKDWVNGTFNLIGPDYPVDILVAPSHFHIKNDNSVNELALYIENIFGIEDPLPHYEFGKYVINLFKEIYNCFKNYNYPNAITKYSAALTIFNEFIASNSPLSDYNMRIVTKTFAAELLATWFSDWYKGLDDFSQPLEYEGVTISSLNDYGLPNSEEEIARYGLVSEEVLNDVFGHNLHTCIEYVIDDLSGLTGVRYKLGRYATHNGEFCAFKSSLIQPYALVAYAVNNDRPDPTLNNEIPADYYMVNVLYTTQVQNVLNFTNNHINNLTMLMEQLRANMEQNVDQDIEQLQANIEQLRANIEQLQGIRDAVAGQPDLVFDEACRQEIISTLQLYDEAFDIDFTVDTDLFNDNMFTN